MEHDPHNAQNWCPDPIGGHEARWFSDGTPTVLVRDDGIESRDPPPEETGGHRWALPPIGTRVPESVAGPTAGSADTGPRRWRPTDARPSGPPPMDGSGAGQRSTRALTASMS